MKKIFAVILPLLLLTGCGNLSPRQEQDIDNQNGRIDKIENIAHGLKLEMGKLESHNEVQDSQIGAIQEGWLNLQNSFENSGVQIFSGPGGLLFAIVALVGVSGMVMMVIHYRKEANLSEKAADILAERIIRKKDPELEEDVFRSAMYTDVEANILKVMSKHQKK